MHIEVQVALNFVISYLYNKLPRRRVNIFGEELERALKDKFRGHWYPEKPFRGSAFRCLKTGDPVDPVLERAARESGVSVQDILENLPHELAVWVDPGEVSYRIGEKGAVKILFNDKHDLSDDCLADREVTKTFNPEAQCFRPIEVHQQVVPVPASKPTSPFEAVGAVGLANLPLSAGPVTVAGVVGAVGQPVSTSTSILPSVGAVTVGSGPAVTVSGASALNGVVVTTSSAPSPIPFKGSPSPVTPFLPRSSAPLTFTTATFAQTKFGSTKLKTNSKRANRMSPTEFSNYIKQRAMQQQVQQQQQQQQQQVHHGAHHHPSHHHHLPPPSQLSPQPQTHPSRSLSPNALAAALHDSSGSSGYFFQPPFQAHFGPPAPTPRGLYDSQQQSPAGVPYLDMYSGGSSKSYSSGSNSFLDHAGVSHQYYNGSGSGNFGATSPSTTGAGAGVSATPGGPGHSPGVIGSVSGGSQSQAAAEKQLLDGFSNFSLGPHPSNSQYQHLLVAN